MTTFERTTDLSLVRSILSAPGIWDGVGDDFAPEREGWVPNADPRIWYVLATEGGAAFGLFTFLPRSTVLWEVHLALLPITRPRGRFILSGGLRWMFGSSTAERIIAEIPACNRLAVRLASQVMQGFGVNPRSFRKHGKLQDLVMFGVNKEDLCPVS